MNIFKRFWQWLFRKPMSFREQFTTELLAYVSTFMDGSFRESAGKNRSKQIDIMNDWVGADRGSPYCITALLWCVDQVCKKMQLKNPIPKQASTQRFFQNAPMEYSNGMTDAIPDGVIVIMMSMENPNLGHAYLTRARKNPGDRSLLTYEFNTGPDHGRDGDGAYAKLRNVDGTKTLKHRGWIDIAAWIANANGKASL